MKGRPLRKRIQVSRAGQELALEAAQVRQRSNERRGLENTFNLKSSAAFRIHRVGALGEVAIYEHFNRDPSPVLEDRNPRKYKGADLSPNVWIRSGSGIHKRLWLREDDGAHEDGVFIWAPVEALSRGIVVFSGWIFGREGLRREYWRKVRADRPAQFYVDASALRPWWTLRNGKEKSES